MKNIVVYSLLFIVLMGIGCTKVDSNDLKEDVPYFQSYDVTYNKTDNTTSASASFKVRDASGTRVELSGDNKIEINGVKAGAGIIDRTFYTWQTPGLQNVTFRLSKNGQILNNIVKTTDIPDISFPPGFPISFTKSAGISFSWVGDLPATGEFISISVGGRNILDTTMNASAGKSVTTHHVVFTAFDLKDIRPGTISISISRSRSLLLDANDGTSGGGKGVTIAESRDAVLY